MRTVSAHAAPSGDDPVREGFMRRNAEILFRYEQGESLTSIGISVGVTRERIRQIVRRFGVLMPMDVTCAASNCPTVPRGRKVYCRQHQDCLDRQGSTST